MFKSHGSSNTSNRQYGFPGSHLRTPFKVWSPPKVEVVGAESEVNSLSSVQQRKRESFTLKPPKVSSQTVQAYASETEALGRGAALQPPTRNDKRGLFSFRRKHGHAGNVTTPVSADKGRSQTPSPTSNSSSEPRLTVHASIVPNSQGVYTRQSSRASSSNLSTSHRKYEQPEIISSKESLTNRRIPDLQTTGPSNVRMSADRVERRSPIEGVMLPDSKHNSSGDISPSGVSLPYSTSPREPIVSAPRSKTSNPPILRVHSNTSNVKPPVPQRNQTPSEASQVPFPPNKSGASMKPGSRVGSSVHTPTVLSESESLEPRPAAPRDTTSKGKSSSSFWGTFSRATRSHDNRVSTVAQTSVPTKSSTSSTVTRETEAPLSSLPQPLQRNDPPLRNHRPVPPQKHVQAPLATPKDLSSNPITPSLTQGTGIPTSSEPSSARYSITTSRNVASLTVPPKIPRPSLGQPLEQSGGPKITLPEASSAILERPSVTRTVSTGITSNAKPRKADDGGYSSSTTQPVHADMSHTARSSSLWSVPQTSKTSPSEPSENSGSSTSFWDSVTPNARPSKDRDSDSSQGTSVSSLCDTLKEREVEEENEPFGTKSDRIIHSSKTLQDQALHSSRSKFVISVPAPRQSTIPPSYHGALPSLPKYDSNKSMTTKTGDVLITPQPLTSHRPNLAHSQQIVHPSANYTSGAADRSRRTMDYQISSKPLLATNMYGQTYQSRNTHLQEPKTSDRSRNEAWSDSGRINNTQSEGYYPTPLVTDTSDIPQDQDTGIDNELTSVTKQSYNSRHISTPTLTQNSNSAAQQLSLPTQDISNIRPIAHSKPLGAGGVSGSNTANPSHHQDRVRPIAKHHSPLNMYRVVDVKSLTDDERENYVVSPANPAASQSTVFRTSTLYTSNQNYVISSVGVSGHLKDTQRLEQNEHRNRSFPHVTEYRDNREAERAPIANATQPLAETQPVDVGRVGRVRKESNNSMITPPSRRDKMQTPTNTMEEQVTIRRTRKDSDTSLLESRNPRDQLMVNRGAITQPSSSPNVSRSHSYQAAAVSPALLSRSPSDLELHDAIDNQLTALSTFLSTTSQNARAHHTAAENAHTNDKVHVYQSKTNDGVSISEKSLSVSANGNAAPRASSLSNVSVDDLGNLKNSSPVTPIERKDKDNIKTGDLSATPPGLFDDRGKTSLNADTRSSNASTFFTRDSAYPRVLRKPQFVGLFHPQNGSSQASGKFVPPFAQAGSQLRKEEPPPPPLVSEREHIVLQPSPRTATDENNFRLFSRRKRSVSQASVDCQDGADTTGASSIRSPTPGSPSMALTASPPWRDPMLATHDWRNMEELNYLTSRRTRRHRPGVTFDDDEDSYSSSTENDM